MTRNRLSAIDRFNSSYIPEPNSGCWIWTGTVSRPDKPYGRMSAGRKTIAAHRFSYLIAKGEIPHGMFVCHRCDTPSCVNPDHLFLGTYLENVKDRDAKGRQAKGCRCWASKFTPVQVEEIRASNLSDRENAKIYGVNKTTIRRLRSRKTYV